MGWNHQLDYPATFWILCFNLSQSRFFKMVEFIKSGSKNGRLRCQGSALWTTLHRSQWSWFDCGYCEWCRSFHHSSNGRRYGAWYQSIDHQTKFKGHEVESSDLMMSWDHISYQIRSDQIRYHIISYHIISYHIISYHIISYHIILIILIYQLFIENSAKSISVYGIFVSLVPHHHHPPSLFWTVDVPRGLPLPMTAVGVPTTYCRSTTVTKERGIIKSTMDWAKWFHSSKWIDVHFKQYDIVHLCTFIYSWNLLDGPNLVVLEAKWHNWSEEKVCDSARDTVKYDLLLSSSYIYIYTHEYCIFLRYHYFESICNQCLLLSR